MARGKKKIKEDDSIHRAAADAIDREIIDSFLEPKIPFAVRMEIEEICRNIGKSFEAMISGKTIEELEDICNKANNPPASWRTRWDG